MTHILVVEDQPELAEALRCVLAFEGFEVALVGDGQRALDHLAEHPVDFILLDLMLPVLDGYQVLTRLRASGNQTAVMMLTARGEEGDRIRGLHLGADDYLVKPFSMMELLERIRPAVQSPVFQSGPFRLDMGTLRVTQDGEALDLSSKQCLILGLLMSHAGTTLDRGEILRHVWPSDSRPSLRAVDVHMTRLRKKLGDNDANGWIRSIASAGYRWTLPVVQL